MYYEEAIIHGVLHSRGDPHGAWVVCSLEQVTQEYIKLQRVCNDRQEVIAVLESRMRAIGIIAMPLERD